MFFYSAEDFFEKCGKFQALSREEERELAQRMKAGDGHARQCIIEGYLPLVAAYVKRMPPQFRTLRMALYCCHALEKAVDAFNFFQESESFSHRLSWYLRNASVKYIADRPCAEDTETQ